MVSVMTHYYITPIIKSEVYLELKRASMMKFFFVKIVNNLLLSQKKLHHR